MGKVDVVVVFYNHHYTWPECVKGLRDNLESINKVIVFKDGGYTEEDAHLKEEIVGLPVVFRSHPKQGHGVARNLNIAMTECTTEYVLVTTAKQKICTGYIEEMLLHAAPKRIVLAPVHNVTVWPDGPITRPDAYTTIDIPAMLQSGRGWAICRNGATLFHRPTYQELGGHNERFCDLGYGNEDYEFGVRWLEIGGDIVWTNATHSIQPIDTQQFKDRLEKQVSNESFKLLAQSALRLFGGRVFLFADGRPLNLSYLQISHDNPRGDLKLDCLELGWVKDGTLKEVHILPNSYLLEENPLLYAPKLADKTAPGGKVVFWGSLGENYEYPMRLAGFEVDVLEHKMECFKGEVE